MVESSQLLPERTSAKAPGVRVTDIPEILKKTLEALTGTLVSGNEALMDVGIDSLSAVELVSTLGHKLSTEIEPTVLFDHPTIGSLCDYLVAQINASSDTSTVQLSSCQIPRQNLWTLYSRIKGTNEISVPLMSRSARHIVFLFSYPFSGSKKLLSYLKASTHLFVCENLCLLPFGAFEERTSLLARGQ
jgi:acyl carrier protein